MDREGAVISALEGAGAGIAGAFALQQVMKKRMDALPQTAAPMTGDPGEFMFEHAMRILPSRVRDNIPPAVERTAIKSLHLGYGLTFATAYALTRRRTQHVVAEGAALGVVTWAAGYLGWLPATGLMPPVTRQRAPQIVAPILEHMLFGIVVVAAVHGLRTLIDRTAERATVAAMGAAEA